jgi:RNA polymerase sigma-70 factor (ECF subfamily)
MPVETHEEEFIRLLGQHRSQMLGYLFCMVRNLPDAEDLFQQTSLTLWDKFDEFTPGSNFASWATTVARNKALTFLRSRRRESARFSDQVLEELADHEVWSATQHEHHLAALSECQQKLSEVDRTLLKQCYGDSLKICDVAGQVGRPVASVYSSLSRIRRNLYQCIQRKVSREYHV